MEQKFDDLRGMTEAQGREYIFQYLSALKLTEKELLDCSVERDKWAGRAKLAESQGMGSLAAEAEREQQRITERIDTLEAEVAELKAQIEVMRRQLPGLAARERSIDPDLLEQELRMMLGKQLEDEDTGKAEKQFREMEQDAAADAALAALKAKMAGDKPEGGTT